MPRDLRSPRYARLREVRTQARKTAGLSHAHVARRLGRPQSYMADIERNERRIDVIEFLTLAEVIGIDPLEAIREVMTADPQ